VMDLREGLGAMLNGWQPPPILTDLELVG
jgi:hypothetical protein